MKTFNLIFVLVFTLSFSSFAQKSNIRAKKGEVVFIASCTVKENAKNDFENFVKNILTPKLEYDKHPVIMKTSKSFRFFEPFEQNKDKSWTYAWMADPMVKGTNYFMDEYLINKYGDVEGKKHWENFLSYQVDPAHPFKVLNFIQSEDN